MHLYMHINRIIVKILCNYDKNITLTTSYWAIYNVYNVYNVIVKRNAIIGKVNIAVPEALATLLYTVACYNNIMVRLSMLL